MILPITAFLDYASQLKEGREGASFPVSYCVIPTIKIVQFTPVITIECLRPTRGRDSETRDT